MNNEEFQEIVIAELKGLKEDVSGLTETVIRIENKLDDLEVHNAEKHLKTEEKLNALIEDSISMQGILGAHEISIRSLRRRPV